jgi:hypothetical protein
VGGFKAVKPSKPELNKSFAEEVDGEGETTADDGSVTRIAFKAKYG